MEKREKLGSRLGFILLSAGCAIGLGNVWKFPYITGQYGGGLFVLIYIIFLFILGVPVLTMEYAIGRASRCSILPAFEKLEAEGTKWHIWGWPAMLGNYVLLMFYSVVTGWLLYFADQMLRGTFAGAGTGEIEAVFNNMMSSPSILIRYMLIVVVITSIVCSIGLQKSVETVSKVVMTLLLAIMVLLAVRSLTLPGASEGLSFYLTPNFDNMKNAGIGQVAYAALNQSFFTLSVGMGGMEIYGSYIDRDHSLAGEAILVTALDFFVALTAGLIIFPACFAYGIQPDAGPSLIFKTLPNLFSTMPGGRIWGSFFFVFMFFAALSTMIGVFENLQAFAIDLKGAKRWKAGIINGIVLAVGSIPCALGFNLWSSFEPLKPGNCIMDLEDFYVSNLVLPIGSLITVLFCTWKFGWGFDKFIEETNAGKGLKVSPKLRIYFQFILPLIMAFIIIYGLVTYFIG